MKQLIPLGLAVALGVGLGYAAAIGGAAEAIRLANNRTEAAVVMLDQMAGPGVTVERGA